MVRAGVMNQPCLWLRPLGRPQHATRGTSAAAARCQAASSPATGRCGLNSPASCGTAALALPPVLLVRPIVLAFIFHLFSLSFPSAAPVAPRLPEPVAKPE
jgi:hypothetical protein